MTLAPSGPALVTVPRLLDRYCRLVEDLDRTALLRLRHIGQRYTDNRRTIVTVLATSGSPLTIPEILLARPELAQSSAYRSLVTLEQAGVVQKLVTNDEWARFELAEDLTEHHHHQICSQCGSVRDFTISARLELSIDEALAKVAEATGFRLQHHRLDLIGLCQSCSA